MVDREGLLSSLDRQRRTLSESMVLTPVDSLPCAIDDRVHTAFLHGLYLTDKVRSRTAAMEAVVQFGGREDAARDLDGINQLLAAKLNAAAGSLRLLSGLQAHAATFMSIASIGDSVLVLPEVGGGHFNTHGILKRLGLRTIDIPIDRECWNIDRDATERVVAQERPDFVFFDRSEGLRFEDVRFIGELDGPVTVFDGSQYLAQILAGVYENPLDWGFDLMLFSLHKSLPGPQKAGIVCRERGELWKRLLDGLSLLVSSSHAENSYLTAFTLLREDWLEGYVDRMLQRALDIETELLALGAPVVDRARQGSANWPTTQHIWIRSPDRDAAFAVYERLGAANIHVNYRKLPYDLGYGLRLGTTYAAAAGLDRARAVVLAGIIAEVIEGRPGAEVRDAVRLLTPSVAAR